VIRFIVGDGAGTVDQGVSTFLFIGALLFGWVAVWRLRGKAFRRLPRAAGWGVGALAVACVVLAIVLPPIIRPDAASTRPSTAARVQIISPQPGQVFRGNPASVPVRLRLTGGRIVQITSTKLNSTDGHIHLLLDGALVAMSYQLSQDLPIAPGDHVITAEFVALDHGPFTPDVRASVSFQVVP
jgi:hypothetical protein